MTTHLQQVCARPGKPQSHLRKRCSTLLALLGCSGVLLAASPPKATPDATALAQAVYDRPAGQDHAARVVMLLESKGKVDKQRLLYSYGIDRGNGERGVLMRFIEPNDIAGTGLLTMDHKGDDSDQWLYLPSLGKVRRIASSRKGGRFVGSDFFYEDLGDREVDMDNHRIIGKDKVGGVPCILLESIPVKKSNSVYSKRVSCIHEKLLLALRVDFYTRGKSPTKRLQASKIRKVQGYWTVYESAMQDLKKDTRTRLVTTDIVYDQGLTDTLFTQRGLADESRELPFRPKGQKP
ncbi:outer membrane lipoprotein-sorting protein [Pseudomaricurvus sp. HS19]|uniref:outer membrane lipoprotein-sorting protein n=1 Tax=Pseudomaricurvus sp. HS19 TaxID=2692626 RepID=UPI0013702D4E|nr:outer membrane lipoprotein-sorting protein [Pseudomaricurvus sp. HS19]MYM64224.1 outer membrane lipoprotein-sorting protein [Pseudomaricurvus sp. HS19]